MNLKGTTTMKTKLTSILACACAVVISTAAQAQAQSTPPKYKADVPKSILTPDKVETKALAGRSSAGRLGVQHAD